MIGSGCERGIECGGRLSSSNYMGVPVAREFRRIDWIPQDVERLLENIYQMLPGISRRQYELQHNICIHVHSMKIAVVH
jgi:hypothetical protein